MPALMLAYEGRVDMLKAVFGGGDEKPTKSGAKMKPATAKNVLGVFRAVK